MCLFCDRYCYRDEVMIILTISPVIRATKIFNEPDPLLGAHE